MITDIQKKVEEAIRKFEKYNDIKIENYSSDSSVGMDDKIPDNYIGQDIFALHVKEWLELFEDEDKYAALELLKNYRYYTERKLRKSLRDIVAKIQEAEMEQEDLNAVYFITFPSKNGVKSGGDDLRSMLQIAALGRLTKDNVIADTQKNIKEILDNADIIVFMDDVVGSGRTMYGNVKQCIDKLELNLRPEIKLYIAVLYGREAKINKKVKELEKLGVKIEIVICEKARKCFDEACIFEKSEAQRIRKIIKEYEKKIEENSESDGKKYILGFEENQFLISFCYNTPNNTLSNFWKPSKISVPLFIRNSYKRPSIDEVRKFKYNNQQNAYIRGQMKKQDVEGE